jgi:acetylcholinesterase
MNIHNLLLSDKRNLFNRAILESSSSYLESSYRNKESALKLTIHFAEKVGCLPKTDNNKNISKLNSLKIEQNRLTLENTYNEKVLKCLLKQNASYLSQKQWEIEYVNEYLKMQFVPTSDYNNLFTLDPFDFDFKTNRFINHDVLAGVNENEGTYFLFYYYNNRYFNLTGFYNQTSTTQYNNAFVTERLIETLTTKYSIKNDDAYFKEYAQCLSSAYTVNTGFNFDLNTELNRNKNSPELAFVKLSKILGDVVFSCPTIKFANKYSESMPDKTYFYKFSQRAKANPWPQWLGVIHAQEIEYIFGLPLRNSALYDDDDRLTSRNIMSYWANFARFGKL